MPTLFKTPTRFLLVCLCALALFGCNTNSQVTHSFVDPEFKKLDLQGVLVVAVARKQSARVQFEDDLTRALKRHGVQATASHTLLPSKKASAEEVIAAAEQAGIDTILVTRYIGEKTDEVYHPGTVYYGVAPAYSPGYNGNFGGYYGRAYEVAYQQPVWTANITHSLISDLYVAKTQAHMWQAVTDTIQSGGTGQVRDDSIDAMIGNLKEKGLLN